MNILMQCMFVMTFKRSGHCNFDDVAKLEKVVLSCPIETVKYVHRASLSKGETDIKL